MTVGWGSKSRAEQGREDRARDKELRDIARLAREDAVIYRGVGLHGQAHSAREKAHGADLERGRKR